MIGFIFLVAFFGQWLCYLAGGFMLLLGMMIGSPLGIIESLVFLIPGVCFHILRRKMVRQ
jgi:hypothetical protein